MSDDIRLDVDKDFELVSDFFKDLALRQIPYAALRTTHDLAFLIRDDTHTKMDQVFHLPTPTFTLRSMEVIKGKDKANPSSWVGLKMDRPWQKALSHQFTGGTRAYKRMENAFKNQNIPGSSQRILGRDEIMIPAEGCPMDMYDNPKRSFIIQLLAYFNAFGEQGYKANMTPKTKKAFETRLGKKAAGAGVEFFVSKGKKQYMGKGEAKDAKRQHLPAGIWQRFRFAQGIAVKPIFIFVKNGTYKRAIDLPAIATEVVSNEGQYIFNKQLNKAMANDRIFKDLIRKSYG